MCGVAGVLYTNRQRSADTAVLKAMGDAIAHRGPDGEGYLTSGHAGLVHRRLAIIDLDGGDQPIANEDGSIHVVFNGEIYNHRQLRRELEQRGHRFRTNSDTEVLVHLYEDFGRDLVTRLRGMFAFAIWDQKRQQLLLARDHLGQKPLYVYRDSQKILFGSELKAILAHPDVDRHISPEAVADYFTYGIIPGRRSIYQNVEKLPAAHTLLLRHDLTDPIPQRYWRLEFGTGPERSDSEWLERIDASIQETVSAHLIADVPVGAFLSGGLDSSAIVACLTGLTSAPLQTFSIGFHEQRYNELDYAEAVARHLGTRHSERIVTPEAVRDLDQHVRFYDEPFADASAIPTMAVSRMAAEQVKVVLSGDGGDEAFGGYARYGHDLKEAAIRDLLPTWFRRWLLRPVAACWPKADWLPRPLRLQTALQNLSADPATAYANTVAICRRQLRTRLLHPAFGRLLPDHHPEDIVRQAFRHGHRDALSGMLAADTAVLLPDDFLFKVDRASMAYGLEVRPPFVDHQLMELAACLPSQLKFRRGSGKWILKRLFEPRLPTQVVHRRKQGFELPIDEWLRGPLREQMHEVVLSQRAPIAEFVDVRLAARIYQRHCQRTGRFGSLLWSLLIFGRWLNSYGPSARQTWPTAAVAIPLSASSRAEPLCVTGRD